MSGLINIWTFPAWNLHGGHGGWAYVAQGDEVRGAAGGERATTAERAALTAAIRALQAAGPAKIGAVHTPSRMVVEGAAALPAWRSAGWRDDKGLAIGDRDLWEALAGLLDKSPANFRLVPAAPAAKTQAAFVAAWAAFALDKVKATGPFTAPIPKPNLAKFPPA